MNTSAYVTTIESKGWCLYDASTDELQTETWEEREARRKPASEVEEGGMYVFVPQPEPGQTLRQAYSVTKGVGPCLRIPDVDSPDYRMLALMFTPRLAVFTRFAIKNAEIGLFTPETPELPECDFVLLGAENAQLVFERDFDVISTEEFQREVAYSRSEWHI